MINNLPLRFQTVSVNKQLKQKQISQTRNNVQHNSLNSPGSNYNKALISFRGNSDSTAKGNNQDHTSNNTNNDDESKNTLLNVTGENLQNFFEGLREKEAIEKLLKEMPKLKNPQEIVDLGGDLLKKYPFLIKKDNKI